MTEHIRDELAPTGVLRAAINLSNFLLVTDKTAAGDPVGVSPDMARAVADRLGVGVEYISYATPGELADAAVVGSAIVRRIGEGGSDPHLAKKIGEIAAELAGPLKG